MNDKKTLLSNLITYQKGKPARKSTDYSSKLHPILNPNYLRTNQKPDFAPLTPELVVLKGGELVLLWDGSNAGEFFKAKSGILASTMVVIDFDKKEFHHDYMFYTLKHLEKNLKVQTKGSGIPHVDKEILLNFEILNPSWKSQELIAEVLTAVDHLIDQSQQTINKYQRIKVGLMQDLLTRGLDENGRLRPPPSQAPHLYQDSPLGLIPKDWQAVFVDEIAKKVTDGEHHTPKRSSSGILLLSARNVLNGHLDLSNVDFVPQDEYERLIKRCHPEHGDILISCSGTVGRICEVPSDLKFALVRSVALVKLKQQNIQSRFAEWVFRSEATQMQILNSQLQVAQSNLFQGAIKQLILPLPTLEEQAQISEVLDKIQDFLKQEAKNSSKLKRLKTGLMQDLLTGKVSVAPLLKEEAE